MILNLDPIHLGFDVVPDVFREVSPDVFRGYDGDQNPVFFYPLTRYLNSREKFVWDVFSFGSNFWDIIKNQVHIFPSLSVDFGLVLSQKEIEYYIWNSWTNKSIYILEPVAVGDYGTTFVVDIVGNFTLQAGKGTPAILTVYTEGPISSATDFEITTTVQGQSPYTYILKTKATRVIVFPFWADWSKKVEFSMKFETVISTSTQNLEQRRPLCAKPKRSISFTHLDTTYGLVTNAINFAQDRSVGVPVVQEMFTLVSLDSDKMGMTMRGTVDQFWNLKRCCNYVVLYEKSTGVLVAKKIVSAESNRIFIENPILEEFDNIDGVVVFPMLIGVFSTAKPTVVNGNLISWEIALSELIGENQPALTDVPALPSSLNKTFDWEQNVNFEQSLYRDIGEFPGTAQILYSKFPLNKNTNKTYTGTFILRTREEIFSFLDFICGAKGRFKKFEYLWPLNEFQLVRGEYEGVNQIRVRNNYFAEQFSKVLNKKIVLRYNGYVLNTSITSVSANSAYTTLTLANPTNFRIYDEDCDKVRIEQYKTVRFDLDEFKFEFLSGSIVKVDVRFKEVYE